MEKRLLAAVVLSLAILLVWQAYFAPKPQHPLKRSVSPAEVPSSLQSAESPEGEYPEDTEVQEKLTQEENEEKSIESPVIESMPQAQPRRIKIISRLFVAEIDSKGAHIESWKLSHYADQKGEALELIPAETANYFPGDIKFETFDEFNGVNYWMDLPEDEYMLDSSHPMITLTCTARFPQGINVQKRYVFHFDRFVVDLDVTLKSVKGGSTQGALTLFLPDRLLNDLDKKDKNRFTKTGPVLMVGGKREVPKLKKITSRWVYPQDSQWVAVQEGFFFTGIIPDSPNAKAVLEPTEFDKEHKHLLYAAPGLLWDNLVLRPGMPIRIKAKMLLGPKKYDLLASYHMGIEEIISFGWFGWLGKLFYFVLISTSSVVKNYGLAIIILTIAIKIILLPLSHISIKSMKKMQEIQPQMKEIQQRYRKDPRKQQEELTKLYRKHGVNPMSGCLPMLVQFPVFIALYQVLLNSIEMRGASFLWASDLSKPDVPLVLIMGVSMLLQQKMSPTGGDPRQAKMMMFMPVLFTAMFWSFPSGLVLYWLMNNVLTILQQYIMNVRGGRDDETKPRIKARTLKKLAEKNIPEK